MITNYYRQDRTNTFALRQGHALLSRTFEDGYVTNGPLVDDMDTDPILLSIIELGARATEYL